MRKAGITPSSLSETVLSDTCAESLPPLAVAYRVPIRQATEVAAASEPKATPDLAGCTEQDYVVGGYAVFTHKAKSSDKQWYRRFYGASMLRGAKGTCGACPITEIGRATPPDHVAARVPQFECPTLSKLEKDSRPATTRDLRSSTRRALQGKIATIFADDDPRFLRGATRGFFLAVSPSRGGLQSSTYPRMHTHRRWGGIGGRGTAADQGLRGGSRFAIITGTW